MGGGGNRKPSVYFSSNEPTFGWLSPANSTADHLHAPTWGRRCMFPCVPRVIPLWAAIARCDSVVLNVGRVQFFGPTVQCPKQRVSDVLRCAGAVRSEMSALPDHQEPPNTRNRMFSIGPSIADGQSAGAKGMRVPMTKPILIVGDTLDGKSEPSQNRIPNNATSVLRQEHRNTSVMKALAIRYAVPRLSVPACSNSMPLERLPQYTFVCVLLSPPPSAQRQGAQEHEMLKRCNHLQMDPSVPKEHATAQRSSCLQTGPIASAEQRACLPKSKQPIHYTERQSGVHEARRALPSGAQEHSKNQCHSHGEACWLEADGCDQPS